MSSNAPRSLIIGSLAPALLLLLAVAPCGCSSSEQSTEQWETASPANASLQYTIDSLTNENRRIKQQLEAMAIENRKITARNAELETKLSEPTAAPAPKAATPAPAPTVKPQRPKSAPSTPRPSGDLTSQYSDALQTYRNRDFSGAVEQFEALLNSGIGEDLAGNCQYWIGQSYYDMKKYKEALPHFETILGMRKSEKKPDAQLMIANSQLALGDKAAAKQAYQKFLSAYPNSPYATKARERLSHLK